MANKPSTCYRFRPLAASDLQLLRTWLARPNMARWWGEAEKELRDIAASIDCDSVKPFIIVMDETPIGYIQSYAPHKEPDHPYRDQPPGTIGIDLSIGEPELVGRGHGPRIIEAFVEEIFKAGAPRVIIDPDPANRAAIRAYRKVGFEIVDRRTTEEYGPALIMARDADHKMSVQ